MESRIVDSIERLLALKEKGALTDDEFASLKGKLLAPSPEPPVALEVSTRPVPHEEQSPEIQIDPASRTAPIGEEHSRSKRLSERVESFLVKAGLIVAVLVFIPGYTLTDLGLFFSLYSAGLIFVGFCMLAAFVHFLSFLGRVESKVDDWASK